jgi:hypothetical protein
MIAVQHKIGVCFLQRLLTIVTVAGYQDTLDIMEHEAAV